jgi:hypothetical protein
MDREGNIQHIGGPGSAHMMPGWGKGAGLSNRNTVGMEVIAKNDADVAPAQIASAKAFMEKYYPKTPVFGHGEVNPGHKEATEGLTITNAIRQQQREQMNAAINPQQLTATGKLDVHVRAPPSTKVDASGDGLFKRVDMRRSVQMAPASSGPPETPGKN